MLPTVLELNGVALTASRKPRNVRAVDNDPGKRKRPTMAATGTRRGTKAAAPVVEDTEDDEFEELEDGTDEGLEELEDEEEAPAPKPKKTTTRAAAKTVDKPKFGSAELAAHV